MEAIKQFLLILVKNLKTISDKQKIYKKIKGIAWIIIIYDWVDCLIIALE